MATSDSPPDTVLDAIVKKLGSLLGSVVSKDEVFNRCVELAETFPIWMLGLDAITRPDESINRLARQTGLWHHQITYDGRAEAFARTRPLGHAPEDWSVEEVSESPIASRISAAIDWIDKTIKDNPEVRLLIVPAYYTHALWLHYASTDSILIADMPEAYHRIKYEHLYEAGEFLKTLSQEQYARGVRPDAGER